MKDLKSLLDVVDEIVPIGNLSGNGFGTGAVVNLSLRSPSISLYIPKGRNMQKSATSGPFWIPEEPNTSSNGWIFWPVMWPAGNAGRTNSRLRDASVDAGAPCRLLFAGGLDDGFVVY